MDIPPSLINVLFQFISFGVLVYAVYFLRGYSTMNATNARSSMLIGTISAAYGFMLLNMEATSPTASLNPIFPMFPTLVGFALTQLPFTLGLALIALGGARYGKARKNEPGLGKQATEDPPERLLA
jgi:ascorbate-specific PTS system EIIC-type component UlaA